MLITTSEERIFLLSFAFDETSDFVQESDASVQWFLVDSRKIPQPLYQNNYGVNIVKRFTCILKLNKLIYKIHISNLISRTKLIFIGAIISYLLIILSHLYQIVA